MASAEIDSTSAGEPSTFLRLDVLVARLNALPAAPRNEGRVVCLELDLSTANLPIGSRLRAGTVALV